MVWALTLLPLLLLRPWTTGGNILLSGMFQYNILLSGLIALFVQPDDTNFAMQ